MYSMIDDEKENRRTLLASLLRFSFKNIKTFNTYFRYIFKVIIKGLGTPSFLYNCLYCADNKVIQLLCLLLMHLLKYYVYFAIIK